MFESYPSFEALCTVYGDVSFLSVADLVTELHALERFPRSARRVFFFADNAFQVGRSWAGKTNADRTNSHVALSACAACSRRAAEVRVAGLLEFVRGVVEVFGSARAFLRESAGPLARGHFTQFRAVLSYRSRAASQGTWKSKRI